MGASSKQRAGNGEAGAARTEIETNSGSPAIGDLSSPSIPLSQNQWRTILGALTAMTQRASNESNYQLTVECSELTAYLGSRLMGAAGDTSPPLARSAGASA